MSFTSLLKKGLVFRHKTLPQPKAPILGNLNHNLFLKDYNKIGVLTGEITPMARSRQDTVSGAERTSAQRGAKVSPGGTEPSWLHPPPGNLSTAGSEPLMGKRRVLGGENE